MIVSLRGKIMDKDGERVVIEAAGVGYEVAVSASTAQRLPDPGAETRLFVSESVAMYGGATTLYGFASREEKQLFLTFKSLPSVGAKKALEHLEKASRSLPDFRRAVLDGDVKVMTGMFRFTKKTAERLISGLKEKLAPAAGEGTAGRSGKTPAPTGPLAQALDALAALGYRQAEARTALESVQAELGTDTAPVEDIVRRALRRL